MKPFTKGAVLGALWWIPVGVVLTLLLQFVAFTLFGQMMDRGSQPKFQEFSIDATVTRHMDNLTGEIATKTTGRLMDPFAIYTGHCDKVLEISYDKGVVAVSVRVGEQLPLVIDGDRWSVDYRMERDGRYLGRLVGEGEISDGRVSGRYESFDVDAEGEERLRYEVRFETSK